MIQLTKTGVVLHSEPDWIEELQQDFADHHCILLSRLIEPAIMEIIANQLSRADFVPREHKGVGLESWLPQGALVSTLHFLINTPGFMNFIEHTTCCGPIGGFGGRIYRMAPSEGHYDSWHGDILKETPRLLTLSLNLSREKFEGGELEIRDKKSEQVLHKVANTGFGDAIVFRIAPNLEHRVAPVRGKVPKTAFAGWFYKFSHDFHAAVRSAAPAAAEG